MNLGVAFALVLLSSTAFAVEDVAITESQTLRYSEGKIKPKPAPAPVANNLTSVEVIRTSSPTTGNAAPRASPQYPIEVRTGMTPEPKKEAPQPDLSAKEPAQKDCPPPSSTKDIKEVAVPEPEKPKTEKQRITEQTAKIVRAIQQMNEDDAALQKKAVGETEKKKTISRTQLGGSEPKIELTSREAWLAQYKKKRNFCTYLKPGSGNEIIDLRTVYYVEREPSGLGLGYKITLRDRKQGVVDELVGNEHQTMIWERVLDNRLSDCAKQKLREKREAADKSDD